MTDPRLDARQRGTFITFEGGEGAGKSTQLARLDATLRAQGYDVVTTREPGGTPSGEALRHLLVQGSATRWTPWSEVLLMTAARVEHVTHVILPALQNGQIVLCDRYVDSTRAYQAGDTVCDEDICSLHHRAIPGGLMPDLTFLLDIAPETGLARASARGAADRFEAKGLDYHKRLRARFHQFAQQETDRIRIVDAAASPDDIAGVIWSRVEERLSGDGDGDV